MSSEKPPAWAKLVEDVLGLPAQECAALSASLAPTLRLVVPRLAGDYRRASGKVAGFVARFGPELTFGLDSPEAIAKHVRECADAVRGLDQTAAHLFETAAARLLDPGELLGSFIPFIVIVDRRAALFMLDPDAFVEGLDRK